MITRLIIPLAALFFVGCNYSDSIPFSGDFAVGEVVTELLELETPDTFYFDFEEDTYIKGTCSQLSVDAQITLYDSAGISLGKSRGPVIGPEKFYYSVSDAGRYMLEVAPVGKKTGAYTLELETVEPVATDPEKRADQLFAPWSGRDEPGAVIGIIRGGEIAFSKAYGMANMSHNALFSVNTPTNIGSISKQFTAFAILLLEKEGKLSLEDDVRKYIPELPDLGQVVRIKNMLNHTNGYRELFALLPMSGWQIENIVRRKDVIGFLQRQEELQNAPGEVFNYNNSAFIMLAEIIERISGQSFPAFMKEHIFAPLGMASTRVRADPTHIIPGSSQGYNPDSLGYHEVRDLYGAPGAGGIYTTPADFARWMGNFNKPVLGDEQLISRLVSLDTLNNGDTMSYALGLAIGERRGLTCYSHGGGDLAHTSFALYFPEIDAGVVAFGSTNFFDARNIAHNMADLYFDEEMEPETVAEAGGVKNDGEQKDSPGVVVPEKLLQFYAGKYFIPGEGTQLEYRLSNDQLIRILEGRVDHPLVAISQSRFIYKGTQTVVEFILNDEQVVNRAVLSSGGERILMERQFPYEPDMDELMALTGRYFSRELQSFCSIGLKDSSLVLLIPFTEGMALFAIQEDLYSGNPQLIGEVKFLRNEAAEVTGFEASSGRTRGVTFVRQ